ncbi:MAG: response regulator [Spirochaetales bacterium]|nr:response regulator [Spirochaetales bacterium]
MYSVMVADDEEIIRNGLSRFLRSDESIELAGSAENGLDAFEKAAALLPDIIFVDINMPYMNGLELIENLASLEKEILVIVVTGYSDFVYAQKALRLGVFDYFLKPIMEEPFFALLDRAKSFVDEQRSLNNIQEQLRDTLEYAVERCLNQLALNLIVEGDCASRLGFLEKQRAFPADLLVISRRKDLPGEEGEGRFSENSEIPFEIKRLADRILTGERIVPGFVNQAGHVVYLLPAGEENPAGRIQAEVPLPVDIDTRRVGGVADLCRRYRELMEGIRRETRYSPQVRSAVDFVKENYADPGLSLSMLSESAHVSPGHLGRLFRQELYRSPMDFLNGYRIERSMEMLTRENWKIYEIAEKTGFTSQHYFSNAFKKTVGQSPLAYRKMREERC